MAWIVVGVLIVLLVVSLGLRTFVLRAVCVLGVGVVGLLFYLYHQYTTLEQTRERPVSVRSREAASGEQRAGTPGTPVAPPSQARPEAVSTPEEAAQAVQWRRAAQAPVLEPASQAALASEDNDALALVDTPTAPAPLAPRVTPIPRVTVIPPSDIPPRATLTPPTVPTPSAVPAPSAPLTPSATPTPSVPSSGSAFKSCDALRAEIRAKFDAKNLTGYVLTIMPSGDLQGAHVVGSCEGNTKKIVLTRSPNAP